MFGLKLPSPDPVSLAISGLSFGADIVRQRNADAARQQDYLNQTAYQDATSEFNTWQAGFNAKTKDLNNQYSYWAETLNYNQQNIYSKQLTNYEFARELQQTQRVLDTRANAGVDYIGRQEALQAQLIERGTQEAVAMQQYQYRALQASAAYQAAGQEGQTMDRFVRNYARQVGDYNSIQQINAGLREKQYTRQQMSQITSYLSQYNSQDFYIRSPIQEPLMPFPPLATMVTPPGPSMRGAAPQSNSWLDTTTAGLGAVNTYFGTAAKIKALGEGNG